MYRKYQEHLHFLNYLYFGIVSFLKPEMQNLYIPSKVLVHGIHSLKAEHVVLEMSTYFFLIKINAHFSFFSK